MIFTEKYVMKMILTANTSLVFQDLFKKLGKPIQEAILRIYIIWLVQMTDARKKF